MSVRVEFRWKEGLVEAVDAARGDVSRAVWVRRAVERALEEPQAREAPRQRDGSEIPAAGLPPLVSPSPAPAEQPRVVVGGVFKEVTLPSESSPLPGGRPLSRAEMFRKAPQR